MKINHNPKEMKTLIDYFDRYPSPGRERRLGLLIVMPLLILVLLMSLLQ